MYKCDFYKIFKDDANEILQLVISGDTRCEMIHNIISHNFKQSGTYYIVDSEFEDILRQYFKIIANDYFSKNEYEKTKYILDLYGDLGLSISNILDPEFKEKNAKNLIDTFCFVIKEHWEFWMTDTSTYIDFDISEGDV